MRTNADVFHVMEEWAPQSLAYDWDNVGLQIGSYESPARKIMITLDVLEPVVDEAIEKDIDLIIAHHPLLFKPLKEINVDTPEGRIASKLMQNNITVYAAHTNLDIASGGVNDMLCDALGIEPQDILVPSGKESLYKFAVYTPQSHKKQMLEVLGNTGAGHIGNYSHCTFQTAGNGTFKPLEGTDPYIGSLNQLEYVDEVKIETIIPEEKLQTVIDAAIEAHPYEEPAYDIYPLENEGRSFGIGRIGQLPETMELKELAEYVKNNLALDGVRVTGDLNRKVKTAAILGGSGEKYIPLAHQKGADVYITGDITFHNAQDAMAMGLSVIDAGHYIEKVMKKYTKQYLDNALIDSDSEIIVSEANTDPFQFLTS